MTENCPEGNLDEYIESAATEYIKNILLDVKNIDESIDSLRGALVSHLKNSLLPSIMDLEYGLSIIEGFKIPPFVENFHDKKSLDIIFKILNFSTPDTIIILNAEPCRDDKISTIYPVTISEYLISKGSDIIETRYGKRKFSIKWTPDHIDSNVIYIIKEALEIISVRDWKSFTMEKNIESHYNDSLLRIEKLPQYLYERNDNESRSKILSVQNRAKIILLVLAHDHVKYTNKTPDINFSFSGFSGSFESNNRINELKQVNIEYSKKFIKFLLDEGTNKEIVSELKKRVDIFVDDVLSEEEKSYLLKNKNLSTIWGREIDYNRFIRYVNHPDSIFTPSTTFFSGEQQANIIRKLMSLSRHFHQYENISMSLLEKMDDNLFLSSPAEYIIKKTNKIIKTHEPESDLNANSIVTVHWDMERRYHNTYSGTGPINDKYPQKPNENRSILNIIDGSIEYESIRDSTLKSYSVSGISLDLFNILKGYDIVKSYQSEVINYVQLNKGKITEKLERMIRLAIKDKEVFSVKTKKHGIIPGIVVINDNGRYSAISIFSLRKFQLPNNKLSYSFNPSENSQVRDFYIWLQDYVPLGEQDKTPWERYKAPNQDQEHHRGDYFGLVFSSPSIEVSLSKATNIEILASSLLEKIAVNFEKDMDFLTKSHYELKVIQRCEIVKNLSFIIGIITAPLSPIVSITIDLIFAITPNLIEIAISDSQEEANNYLMEMLVELGVMAAFNVAPHAISFGREILHLARKKIASNIIDQGDLKIINNAFDNIDEPYFMREGLKSRVLVKKVKSLLTKSLGGDFVNISKYSIIDDVIPFKQSRLTSIINKNLSLNYKDVSGYCRGVSISYLVDKAHGKLGKDFIHSISTSISDFESTGNEQLINYIIKNQFNQVYYKYDNIVSYAQLPPDNFSQQMYNFDSLLREMNCRRVGDVDDGSYLYFLHELKSKSYWRKKSQFLVESDTHGMGLSFDHGKATFLDPNSGELSVVITNDSDYVSFVEGVLKYIENHYSDSRWGGSTSLSFTKITTNKKVINPVSNPLNTPRNGLLSSSQSEAKTNYKGRVVESPWPWTWSKHVGFMSIGGEDVKVYRSRWNNVYQVGDDQKILIDNNIVKVENGKVSFLITENYIGFNEYYQQWNNGGASLVRGISSSHFSWDKIITDKVLASEGVVDLPQATMGDTIKVSWLPTALDTPENRAMVTGVALGNHVSLVRDKISSGSNDVIAGAILRIDVGPNKNIYTTYLYNGEIVVRGPLSHPDFIIDTLITGDLSRPIDISSITDYDEFLPLQAPYDPKELPMTQELAIHWLNKSKEALEKIRNECSSPVERG
jgi:hypothetical protein